MRARMTHIPRTRRALVLSSLVGFSVLLGTFHGIVAQSVPTPVTFTTVQADEGRPLYVEQCASCHGQYLDDGQFGPALKGVDFRARWSRPTDALFTTMSTSMPPARPGTFGDTAYAQLLAFILQENGSQSGERELPGDPVSLKAMGAPTWPPVQGGGIAPGVKIPPSPPRVNPLDKIRPVTEAMLNKVPDGDWLMWRRTYDAAGFSPLNQINRSNLSDLRMAWTWSLPSGANESTPIVHDGALFVHGYGAKVQSLDAPTCGLLWQ